MSKWFVHVHTELYTMVEKVQTGFVDPVPSNHSRLLLKEPSLPINELLEKNGQEDKFILHPLPPAVWPKHTDLAPIPRHHSLHNKSKKALKSDRLLEHNSEKSRQTAGLLPKTPLTGSTAAATTTTTSTVQKTNPDAQSNISPPLQSDPDGQPNSRPRGPVQPQAQPPQPANSPRKDPPNRRLDPEENRPGKSSLYQSSIDPVTRNNSRPSVIFNRRSPSLLYQFDILRRGAHMWWILSCGTHTISQLFTICFKSFRISNESKFTRTWGKRNIYTYLLFVNPSFVGHFFLTLLH